MFQKKLIITLNLHCLFIAVESITWILFIFWSSKIHISQPASSSFFPLPGATSPPADIATPQYRAVSRIILMEPRRAHCLLFIF
jgi:hypothetical protein